MNDSQILIVMGYALCDLGQDADWDYCLQLGKDLISKQVTKLPGRSKRIQDRFASVYQRLRLPPQNYESTKERLFETWDDLD